MFDEYVLDRSWLSRSRQGWTALVSFALQSLAVAGLLVAVLFRPEALPRLAMLGSTMVPLPPPANAGRAEGRNPVVQRLDENALLLPSPIPVPLQTGGDDSQAADAPTGPWVPGVGRGDAAGNGFPDALGTGMRPAMPAAPAPPPPRISQVMEGNLIRRVQPDYPSLARQARVQGAVVLRAVIDRDGVIQNLQVISGPALLVAAAINAVRQWRYRPFYLNGQPVEVETQVTVNFTLAGG